MRSKTADSKLTRWATWLVAVILVLLPFHAFLTVWLNSFIGHYTWLRLWKEVLLLFLVSAAVWLLIKDSLLRRRLANSWLTKLIVIYAVMTLVWGAAAYSLDKVTLKALGYGLIVNLRFLLFFGIVMIIANKSQLIQKMWPKLLLIPAAVVVFIGLLQRFAVPYDVLKHFGYSAETIFPYQTVNYNVNYPRIMSTLRGANPLGAYLVLILSSIFVLFMRLKNRRWLLGALGLGAFLALVFSYSRGAWVGLGISLIVLAWISLRRRVKQIVLIGLVMLAAFGIGFGLAVGGNKALQNAIFHTDDESNINLSSNEEHLANLKAGFNDALSEPLGRGVGSAGPASVYNQPAGKTRIADNYFVQIAQEMGWIGLGLFAAINVLLVRQLWLRRQETLALVLLTSFVGLTAVNLVSHAWSDDTLAYIWWGLAGLALSPRYPAAERGPAHR